MMNQSIRLLFLSCGALLLSSTLAEEKENVLTPTRISFQSLENLLSLDHPDHQIHVDHISSVLEGVGLFSITDIPLFRKEKPETLRELPKCVDALLLKGRHGTAARHVLADGTIRKTIATTGDEPDLLLSSTVDQRIPEACETLQQVSGAFRSTVAEVTRTVGRVLLTLQSKSSQNSNNNNNDKPLVLTTKEGDETYNLAEMVTYGEHLEHFHVYNKPTSTSTGSTSTTAHPTTTIDWHTDQGLMLVFSPGMMIMNTHNQQQRDRKTTFYQQEHDFKIQLPNGTAMSVQFDPIKDDLVVMLGQGVEQYVSGVNFRAVPHSLSLQPQQQSTNSNRVWYGRMVLPPADAIHPLFHNSGQTFGSIRQELIAARNNNNTTDTSMSVLGCSSSSTTTTTTIAKQQRQLQDQTEEDCNLETQHFCWHTCIDYSQDISPTACAAATDDHVVACVNTKTDELWPGNHNPDFNLGCVAAERVEAFYNNTSTSSTEQETNSSSNEGHEDSHSAAEGGLETDDAKDDQLTTAPSSSATTFTGTMGKTTFAMLMAGLVCIF